jgi:hypothetical protein
MIKVLIAVLSVFMVSLEAKTEVTKVIIPDTTVTVKQDTIRMVSFDTLKITKTLKDTSVFVKADTVISKSKPRAIKK